jgi:hypothetical protein
MAATLTLGDAAALGSTSAALTVNGGTLNGGAYQPMQRVLVTMGANGGNIPGSTG